MKEEQARDRIIEATIELINENAGDINKITARLIAYHAGISSQANVFFKMYC